MDTYDLDVPPRLVVNKFVMWKLRMKSFLCLLDYDLWRSIAEIPYVPMTDNAIPKDPSDYSDEDKMRIKVDWKAYALVTMGLPSEILRGLLHCKSAKELWDGVCERYQETPEVVQKRKNLLIQQFELFGYISGESLTQQFERFVSLVSDLKTCDKYYENGLLLDKFMRSLPSCWTMYTMKLRNSMDFDRTTLTQLHGHYELQVNQGKEISRVDISSLIEDMEQFQPDDLEEMDLQHQTAMLNLRVKRFTERTGRSFDRNPQTMRFGVDKSKAMCYKCQNTGHFARECSSPAQAFDWSFFGQEFENAAMGNTERYNQGL